MMKSTAVIALGLWLMACAAIAASEDRDALSIPTVNCMDEFHFCFGARGNMTSISKRDGCLADSSCDVIVIADASNVERIRWNVQIKRPDRRLEEGEKVVAHFYLSNKDVCHMCTYDRGLTAYYHLPDKVLIVESQWFESKKSPQIRQYMIRKTGWVKQEEEALEPTEAGARVAEQMTGEDTFELRRDVVAPQKYWGIMFVSGRKVKYGRHRLDVLRDHLHPHLVLTDMWHEVSNGSSPDTMPRAVDVITNIGISKFLLFSDKEDESEYHAAVRTWTIVIIVMLTLLLVAAIGWALYYRSQVRTSVRHRSPDNINDVFDQ